MTYKFTQSIVPTPSFWGTRILNKLSVTDIIPYIHLNSLYHFHWGLDDQHKELAETTFKRLVKENQENSIIQPRAIYGYFACQSADKDLMIYANPTAKKELCRFTFPRQSSGQMLCLTDFFRSASSKEFDVVALQLVTVGTKAANFARNLFKKDEYQKYLFWRGFNAAMADGFAELVHHHIRLELGFQAEEPSPAEILKQQYHGKRFSLGYPACPNLEDQQKIMTLLDAKRIGVALSETFQLIPEESTSAIIVHHPKSRHFAV